MEKDDPSTQGDKSSHSQESSETSDSSPQGSQQSYSNDLEALLKNDILRATPELADCFYQKVKDILECASPDNLAHVDQSGGISLLREIELEAFGLLVRGESTGSVAPVSYSGPASDASSRQSTSTSTGQADITNSSSSKYIGILLSIVTLSELDHAVMPLNSISCALRYID